MSGRASQERELKKRERMRRLRRDRPEFVHLASMSSGITSQNGQTQTEDRKMDVRGCTKGKGGGTMKRRKEGGRGQHRQEVVEDVEGVKGEEGEERGHNTTTIQHNNDKNEHRTQK